MTIYRAGQSRQSLTRAAKATAPHFPAPVAHAPRAIAGLSRVARRARQDQISLLAATSFHARACAVVGQLEADKG